MLGQKEWKELADNGTALNQFNDKARDSIMGCVPADEYIAQLQNFKIINYLKPGKKRSLIKPGSLSMEKLGKAIAVEQIGGDINILKKNLFPVVKTLVSYPANGMGGDEIATYNEAQLALGYVAQKSFKAGKNSILRNIGFGVMFGAAALYGLNKYGVINLGKAWDGLTNKAQIEHVAKTKNAL